MTDNEKNQVDEMENDLRYCHAEYSGDYGDIYTDYRKTAEKLVVIGYRKQVKGKWKQAYNRFPRYVCTNCNHLFNNKSFRFCPNCGARMKGGE